MQKIDPKIISQIKKNEKLSEEQLNTMSREELIELAIYMKQLTQELENESTTLNTQLKNSHK